MGHATLVRVALQMLVQAAPPMLAQVEHAMLVRVVLLMRAPAVVLMPAQVEHLMLVRVVLQMLAPVARRTLGPAVHATLVPVGHAILVLEADGIARPFVNDSNRRRFRTRWAPAQTLVLAIADSAVDFV